MFPYLRFFGRMFAAKRQPQVGLFEESVITTRIGLFDIDPWMELNNGRTQTLYDIARVPHYARMETAEKFSKFGIFVTVAGSSMRYRNRVRPFTKVEIRTRLIGWDEKFFYTEQSMWRAYTCFNHGLIRQAFGRRGKGLVPPPDVMKMFEMDPTSPELPNWVAGWISADAERPWPPMSSLT